MPFIVRIVFQLNYDYTAS